MPYGPDNLCKTNDNGFAFVGYSSGNNVYMVKLNSEYEIEWHKQVYARPGQTDTKNLVKMMKDIFMSAEAVMTTSIITPSVIL